MSNSFPRLFSALELRGRVLRNRIVSTAHTTNMAEGGVPAGRLRAYYVERARGGVALIVTEPIPAHATARVTPDNFVVNDDRIVEPLAALVEAVKAEGTALVCQIYHAGGYANPYASLRELWMPSALTLPCVHGRPRAISKSEICEVVRGFAGAAARVAQAGGDGVEVSAGHLGLIDAFVSPLLNRRQDEYGGKRVNRLRLALEVVSAVRESLGGDRILGVTVSGNQVAQGTSGPEELAEAAADLVERCEVDYLAVTSGSYLAGNLIIPTMDVPQGSGIEAARVFKRALPATPVLAQGRIKTPEMAERALSEGTCDLVGMTRALIADPRLPEKAKAGRVDEIRPCIGCNQLCWGRRTRQFFISCLQYPAAGFEAELSERKLGSAARSRRIVVVGGGPAGLEAARVAAERGHEVTLLEGASVLGGQARLASRMPHHGEFIEVVSWRVAELARLGVALRTGLEATAEAVAELEPDAVLVAAGSQPDTDWRSVPLGARINVDDASDRVFSAVDVLARNEMPPGPVVLLDHDGFRKTFGAAEFLAERGHEVTIVIPGAAIGPELDQVHGLSGYLARLGRLQVRYAPLSTVTKFDGSKATIRDLPSGGERLLPAAALVISAPHVPNDELAHELKMASLFHLHIIGDARAPRGMDAAIRDAYVIARSLD